MTHTLELRWFFEPPCPPAVRDAFETLGAVETTQQRDLYLPSEDPALNLKLRNGQVQVKRRLAGPFALAVGPEATGCAEHWGKWHLPPADDPSSVADDDPTGLWRPVHKTRHQWAMSPSAQADQLSGHGLPTAPPAMLNAELTTVAAGDAQAWTLCLEAEGPVPALSDTLRTAAPLLFGRLPLTLSTETSYGYARWLRDQPSVRFRPNPDAVVSGLP